MEREVQQHVFKSSKEIASEEAPVTSSRLMDLIEQQEYRCALSGRTLTPNTSSLDHIVPLTSGGKHVMDNVQIVLKEVNRMKGTMSNESFISLCRAIAAWSS